MRRFATLKAQEERRAPPDIVAEASPVNWRKSITQACRKLPGMRQNLQAVIHPSSGEAGLDPVHTGEARYSTDPAAYRSRDH